jgi:hypothetical protein
LTLELRILVLPLRFERRSADSESAVLPVRRQEIGTADGSRTR